MKEKFVSLKKEISEYNRLHKKFESLETLFNLKVDELCEENGYVIAPAGLTEEEVNRLDSYGKAKAFFKRNEQLCAALDCIRKGNNGENKMLLRDLYLDFLVKDLGYQYKSSYLFVNNYHVFSEAGYHETREAEIATNGVLKKITARASELKSQGIASIDEIIEGAKKKVTPYIHEGSKTLAKVFTNIANKTEKKND